MKIAISAGHNVFANGYFDNGTRGYGRVEAQDVKKVASLVIIGLRIKGYEVLDVTPYNQRFVNNRNGSAQKNSHLERANRVTRFKPDLYLDFHLNAGGGTGPETIVYSTNSPAYKWARLITNSIASKTGLSNRRGVRVRPNMWSVSLQTAPSIIVEGGFMDTRVDMVRLTPEVYAEAIVAVFPNLKGGSEMSEARIRQIVKEELVKVNNSESVGAWAKQGMDYVQAEKIMEGYEDGTWKPNKPVTRAELAAVIYRISKE